MILGNHDYGDKCYDEPPGCYVYGGDTFYSPLHQVVIPCLYFGIQGYHHQTDDFMSFLIYGPIDST